MKHTPGPWRIETHNISKSILGKKHLITDQRGIPVIAVIYAYDDNKTITPLEQEANARVIAAAPDGLHAAELAYLHLLKIPHDRLRLKGQVTLCALRDFIAKATGREEEDVQNEYESRALEEMHKDHERVVEEGRK